LQYLYQLAEGIFPDRQKSPIAALLTKASSIDVPYVRLNHRLSLMPCS